MEIFIQMNLKLNKIVFFIKIRRKNEEKNDFKHLFVQIIIRKSADYSIKSKKKMD